MPDAYNGVDVVCATPLAARQPLPHLSPSREVARPDNPASHSALHLEMR